MHAFLVTERLSQEFWQRSMFEIQSTKGILSSDNQEQLCDQPKTKVLVWRICPRPYGPCTACFQEGDWEISGGLWEKWYVHKDRPLNPHSFLMWERKQCFPGRAVCWLGSFCFLLPVSWFLLPGSQPPFKEYKFPDVRNPLTWLDTTWIDMPRNTEETEVCEEATFWILPPWQLL